MGLRALARSLPLDAFLIDHFRVLPTNPDYRALSDDAKEMLFFMVTEGPPSEEVRRVMLAELAQKADPRRPADKVKEDAKAMGIDLEKIDAMIAAGDV